ncbi:MAG: ChaN family lipoprotein, partial [Microcystis panniformis]
YIPPKSEIKQDNEEYRQQILAVYEQHTGGSSQGFDRFFLAQVLWDETMADAIAKFWQAHPEYQIIVLAGKGHIAYGYGIPSRVQRRLGDRVSQRSVFLGDAPQSSPAETKKPADYFWQGQN